MFILFSGRTGQNRWKPAVQPQSNSFVYFPQWSFCSLELWKGKTEWKDDCCLTQHKTLLHRVRDTLTMTTHRNIGSSVQQQLSDATPPHTHTHWHAHTPTLTHTFTYKHPHPHIHSHTHKPTHIHTEWEILTITTHRNSVNVEAFCPAEDACRHSPNPSTHTPADTHTPPHTHTHTQCERDSNNDNLPK